MNMEQVNIKCYKGRDILYWTSGKTWKAAVGRLIVEVAEAHVKAGVALPKMHHSHNSIIAYLLEKGICDRIET